MKKFLKYSILLLFVSGLSMGLYFFYSKDKVIKTNLPPAQTYEEAAPVVEIEKKKEAPAPDPAPVKKELPSEVNLKVPFTSQAPHQNWDLPYKEFCEEASVLMVYSYLKNQPILNAGDADAKMLAVKEFEMKKFGYYEDANIEETAVILREFYKLDKIKVVANPTVQDIKKALAEGKAVILPLAGQEIGNPFYHQPGPLYHMLVVKGYTKEGSFITNDPGTRRGADFIYNSSVIMNAISDWDHGTNDINHGKKAMIVAG